MPPTKVSSSKTPSVKRRCKDSSAVDSESSHSAGSSSSRTSQLLTKAKGTVKGTAKAAKKTFTKAVNFITPKKSALPGSVSESPVRTRRGTIRGSSTTSLESTAISGERVFCTIKKRFQPDHAGMCQPRDRCLDFAESSRLRSRCRPLGGRRQADQLSVGFCRSPKVTQRRESCGHHSDSCNRLRHRWPSPQYHLRQPLSQ
ncbi:hypothetical protein B0H10DRAFT_2029309 [Mycena sp. CBHHK59/15]|nr:hypothetical protein B0H10DRAFT_2029309 [Mycena sp. CBHHK59/15]